MQTGKQYQAIKEPRKEAASCPSHCGTMLQAFAQLFVLPSVARIVSWVETLLRFTRYEEMVLQPVGCLARTRTSSWNTFKYPKSKPSFLDAFAVCSWMIIDLELHGQCKAFIVLIANERQQLMLPGKYIEHSRTLSVAVCIVVQNPTLFSYLLIAKDFQGWLLKAFKSHGFVSELRQSPCVTHPSLQYINLLARSLISEWNMRHVTLFLLYRHTLVHWWSDRYQRCQARGNLVRKPGSKWKQMEPQVVLSCPSTINSNVPQ